MTKHPPNHAHTDGDMIKMEVNLDDISGEILGYVMELLLEKGANDVFYTPIYMKKNRPAVLLQLLCTCAKVDALKEILFRETTTLGIRYYPITVERLARSFRQIDTRWGPVTVKEGFVNGALLKTSPEYEDCKRIAKTYQVPLHEVYDEVKRKLQAVESVKYSGKES